MGCGSSSKTSAQIETTIQATQPIRTTPAAAPVGQVNAARPQQPTKQPLDKYDKLPKPVLNHISAIFSNYAQIDPHRKRPVPKMAKVKAKERELGVVRPERPGTVPGQLKQIRGENAPEDPSTRQSRQGKRGIQGLGKQSNQQELPPGVGKPDEDFPMGPPIQEDPFAEHSPKNEAAALNDLDDVFGDATAPNAGGFDIPIEVTSGAPEPASGSAVAPPPIIDQPTDTQDESSTHQVVAVAEADRSIHEQEDKEKEEEEKQLAAELAAKQAEIQRLESMQRKGKEQVDQEERQILDLEIDGVITAGDKVEVKTYEVVAASREQEDAEEVPTSEQPVVDASDPTEQPAVAASDPTEQPAVAGSDPAEDYGTKAVEEPLPMGLPDTLMDKDFFSDDEPAEQYEITTQEKEQEQIFTKAGRDSPEPPRMDLMEIDEEDLPPGVTREELRAQRLELEKQVTLQGSAMAAAKRAEYDAQLEQDKNKAKNMEDEAAALMAKYS